MPAVVHKLLPKLDMMRASIICIIGMGLWSPAGAESLLEGRVRLESGEPAVRAQVLLFDLEDLRAAPVAATTDHSGGFTLPLATLAGILPEQFELGANFPNPFNPSTMIPYQLPTAMYVRLEVFNILGQRVATLVEGEKPAGFHTASWDATDAAGEAVGAGVYLYRLSGHGVQLTRSMLLIDGQAGVSRAGPAGAAPVEDEAGEMAPVYGLIVSGPGLVPYIDPAFRLEAGMPPLDLVVEAPGSVSSAKAASSGGILGDVDNNGRVDFFDPILVALYSRDASIVMPNNGDISLGDVDADGQVDLTDAWLIAVWLNDPSDPALPAGIGEPVGPAASLSPDPSTVTFSDDGAWHRFTVEAGEPVSVVANPGTTPRLEITTRSGRGNFCPAEADDDVSRRDGQAVYLAGCATGTATVELRRPSDGTVLNTYTFEVTGSPADLVVRSVSVSDSTLTPGQSFTLSATVRNQGTGRSAATTLRYYRSSNRTISTQDTEVGTDPVGALSASRTSAESIRLTAPSSAGTYYYGGCVAGVAGESAGNNCSAGVRVRAEAASPDLVVQSASVNDSSLTPGQSFTLNATVRNQGTGQSAATTLRYYRSTNATISTQDTQVGTDLVGVLAASGSSEESISLTAPASEGTWYYGACVESVSDEYNTGNNCSAAITVTVGAAPAPDLVVDAPTVSNSGPAAGASFTLSATVRNQGAARSSSTTLRYYRSTDATVSTSDTQVGTDPVSSLSASRTSSESISLRAPSSAGTYYYGACVESVSDESDTGNNCSSAVTVTVGAAPAPDLVVDAPTVSNSGPAAGASFTLSATVRNQGAARSGSTTLRYYRSTDATVSTSDTQVGTDPVTTLSASRTSAESISLRAPSSTGTYYYGACVESVSDESDTGNNCSAAITVTVGAAPAPDLVVDAPTVSNSSPTAGASFTLSATVRNQGAARSSSTTLRYYRSTDATVSTSDTQVGTDPVSSLSASRTSSESIFLSTPSNAGTYYYGACVESVSDESDTGNNCSSAVTVTVGAAPSPDLVVDSPTVSNSSPTAGASFRLSATVRNQGNGQSAATTLRFYRSTDGTISASDTEVGSHAVGGLAASGTSDHSTGLTAPSSPGTYYYGACVGSVSDETETGNNCSSTVTVTVGAELTPDLVVDAPTVSNSSPTAGASFRLSATVRNQGNGQSAATTLRFYRSTNATISASDTEVGSHAVGGLAASGTSDNSTDLTALSSTGTYYYGACVESVSDESDTGNNCSAAVTVTVGAPPAPDLVVDAPTVSNSSPTAGASFRLNATVRNQGNGQSAATTLRFYRSTNATISASDTEVGSHAVGGLAASGTSDHSTDLTALSSTGTYYYGACVESVSDESDTGNNCSSAVTVTVGAAPAPDLVVDSPQVSNDSPTAGASFRLSATVRNQGNGQSAATTLRFYRSTNATISASDTEVGSHAVGGLAASGTSDHSTDLTAPSSAGTYYYGACVESVSGESATGNNCSSAFAVTVGTPDLVVGTPQATSRNPTAGASFHLSVAIENQGTGPSAATTLRFYRSTDGTISASDTEVGSHAVSLLGVGVWHVVSAIPVTAPASAGTYYYGACVESVSGESNTGNNCSPALTVNVVSAPAPDLVVDAPTVSTSSPTAGASFTLSATVRNQGNGQSAATTLRFYRSTDATISDSDNEVGSHAVGGLAASGTSDHSSDLTAPSDAGTYYYGACVGSVSDESDTGNNCSPAVTVTVSATVTQPDPQPAAVSKLYWSDWGTDKIQRADLDGSNVEDLISGAGLDGPDGLSLDLAGGKIYWVDAGTKKIQRANLDGSGIEDLLTDQNFPFGLALDVSGGKMYWTNPFPAKIQRANLDGSGAEDLVTSGLTIAGGLALDVAGGKMYWTNRGTAPGTAKIQRADLSGSNVEDLVTSGLTGPHGLALDVAGGKMYWTDRGTDKIQRADLSGSNVEDLVASGLHSPSGIALDVAGGKIYWTDAESDKVQRANLDGSGVEDLLTSSDGLVDPSGIALGAEAVSGSN